MKLPFPCIERPSPNFDERAAGRRVDMLLLHYTGMPGAREALDRMTDPDAKVSAHYMIDRDGTVFALVDETKRAWHAGVASWRGQRDINSSSVGIELVNPGHEWGYEPFTEPLMSSLIVLARRIVERHAIPAARVLGHSDVAPARKTDPGELFDWKRLAELGVGVWPAAAVPPIDTAPPLAAGASGDAVAHLQRRLGGFGYGIDVTGDYDRLTEQVVTAFQRHWRPSRVDGIADAETGAILEELLDRALLKS